MKAVLRLPFLGACLGILLSGSLSVPAISGSRDSQKRAEFWNDPSRCTPVELDAPGGPFADYPFEYQSGTYACYGFSGAKIYDAYLFSKGVRPSGVHSNPVQATLDYADLDPMISGYRGGFACDVADHLIRNGGCPDRMADRGLDKAGSYGDYLERLLKLREEYQEILAEAPRLGEQKAADRRARIERKAECYLRRRASDPAIFGNLEPIAAFLADPRSDAAINGLLFGQTCPQEERLRIPDDALRPSCVRVEAEKLSSEDTPAMQRARQFDELGDLLSRKIPPAVSTCLETLTSAGSRVQWSRNPPGPDLSRCGSHVVVVIGRRFENGRCRLKVFDSTGVAAGSGGKVWVDAMSLMENTWAYSAIVESP